jgi:hypothetical protein
LEQLEMIDFVQMCWNLSESYLSALGWTPPEEW